MHIADAATLILIVTWAVNLTPGWLVFAPIALAVIHEAGKMAEED